VLATDRLFDRPSVVLEKLLNRVVPIPRQPKPYRSPPPPKPVSWVPKGKLGNQNYEARLDDFAPEILAIDAQRTQRIRYSGRGWCYLLEGLAKIDKGDFNSCQKAINDCRKTGRLPIDFVADDQDETRRFRGIFEASDPAGQLRELQDRVRSFWEDLPSQTTDYWNGEKHYLMMCVEKGDLLRLFEPVCREYRVPVVSSKGWAPILVRAAIASLSQKAEARGLQPVLLLFYDHDPAGLKISDSFREKLQDCEQGTGWSPEGLVIDRFGLNADDIERHHLAWIENLETGSGREARAPEYERRFGRRKCEANALFKNDATLRAGRDLCRKAIEKYYGRGALKRFRRKEKRAGREVVSKDAMETFEEFCDTIDGMVDRIESEAAPPKKTVPVKPRESKEVEVRVDGGHYGRCPGCGASFDYDAEKDIGRLMRCRGCHLPMRLKPR
jgi:hypothetical protein